MPAGTPPGDDLAAIVGADAGGPLVGGDLVLRPRVALVVRVSVVGHSQPGLRLGRVRSRRVGGRETMSLNVTNTGNELMSLGGTVAVRGTAHATVSLGPSETYVIPGGTATLTGSWSNLPFAGRVVLDASVVATVSGQPALHRRAAPVALVFIPSREASAAAVTLAGFATVSGQSAPPGGLARAAGRRAPGSGRLPRVA